MLYRLRRRRRAAPRIMFLVETDERAAAPEADCVGAFDEGSGACLAEFDQCR